LPIVTLGQRKVEAVEALVRWQHPTLGLLAPDEFLDVAEETGLVVPLGKQVLRDACTQIRMWRERYDENLMVSVNLSAAQLRDESIVDALALALKEAGVESEALFSRSPRARSSVTSAARRQCSSRCRPSA
jgi:EAL domain-containing protein (putative c-di-GMP-specific phosphodiesterase class I)